MESIKCVVVGDRVGKTSMLVKYTTKEFPKNTIPTSYEKLTKHLCVDGKTVTLHLIDTSGSDSHDRLRPMMYPRTEVCIVCFSLEESHESFERVRNKWWPELMYYLPKTTTPLVLVGTKKDVRDANLSPEKIKESQAKGQELAKFINAVKYLECSALENIGLYEIFKTCVRAVRQPPHLQTKQNAENLVPSYIRSFTCCCTIL